MRSRLAANRVFLLVTSIVVVFTVVIAWKLAEHGRNSSPARSGAKLEARAMRLYAIGCGQYGEAMADRVDAVKALAQCPEGGAWVVLTLVSSQKRATGDSLERLRRESRRSLDLGLVAAMIQALPMDADAEVLWALTLLLDEKESGRWSEKTGRVMVKISEHNSAPIRELARDCLRERLGVDHGWNVGAWQRAIAASSRSGGVEKAPASGSTSQPAPVDN